MMRDEDDSLGVFHYILDGIAEAHPDWSDDRKLGYAEALMKAGKRITELETIVATLTNTHEE